MIHLEIKPELRRLHLRKYAPGIRSAIQHLANGYVLTNKDLHNVQNRNTAVYVQYYAKLLEYLQSDDIDDNLLTCLPCRLRKLRLELCQIERNYPQIRRGMDNINAHLKVVFDYDVFAKGEAIIFNEVERFIEHGIVQYKKSLNDDDKVKRQLIEWNAWGFISSFHIKYCPYCNAETVYAGYVNKNGETVPIRSSLDHFYCKKKYPYLALSLYNLVPSCDRCNTHIKGDAVMPGGTIHPFIDDFHHGASFDLHIDALSGLYGNQEHFDIQIGTKDDSNLAKKAEQMADLFSISNVYNSFYKEEIANIIRKLAMYGTPEVESEYREYLTNTLFEGNSSKEEIDAFIWGASLESKYINRHRFAKLIIDLHKNYEDIFRYCN